MLLQSRSWSVRIGTAGDRQATTPQSLIMTLPRGLPNSVPMTSIFFTTSIPDVTFPNTTCLPFSHGVSPTQMKNCWPFPKQRVVRRQVVRAYGSCMSLGVVVCSRTWLPLVLGPAYGVHGRGRRKRSESAQSEIT